MVFEEGRDAPAPLHLRAAVSPDRRAYFHLCAAAENLNSYHVSMILLLKRRLNGLIRITIYFILNQYEIMGYNTFQNSSYNWVHNII